MLEHVGPDNIFIERDGRMRRVDATFNGEDQLYQTIDRIDGDTQQNAAFVEETSQVAASLRSQVDALVAAVASFRLDGQEQLPRITHTIAGVPVSPRMRNAA